MDNKYKGKLATKCKAINIIEKDALKKEVEQAPKKKPNFQNS